MVVTPASVGAALLVDLHFTSTCVNPALDSLHDVPFLVERGSLAACATLLYTSSVIFFLELICVLSNMFVQLYFFPN